MVEFEDWVLSLGIFLICFCFISENALHLRKVRGVEKCILLESDIWHYHISFIQFLDCLHKVIFFSYSKRKFSYEYWAFFIVLEQPFSADLIFAWFADTLKVLSCLLICKTTIILWISGALAACLLEWWSFSAVPSLICHSKFLSYHRYIYFFHLILLAIVFRFFVRNHFFMGMTTMINWSK